MLSSLEGCFLKPFCQDGWKTTAERYGPLQRMANAGGGMTHGPCRHVAGRRTADDATTASYCRQHRRRILEHVVAVC